MFVLAVNSLTCTNVVNTHSILICNL
jgi:hypothetical protein